MRFFPLITTPPVFLGGEAQKSSNGQGPPKWRFAEHCINLFCQQPKHDKDSHHRHVKADDHWFPQRLDVCLVAALYAEFDCGLF